MGSMTTPLHVHGADVSHWQGTLDLVAARKAGLQFLYAKATESTSYVDPTFASRRTQADKANVPFGGYHFARPRVGNAAAEAKHFLTTYKPEPGDLRPALDIEVNTGGLSRAQLTTWVGTWVKAVEKATGVKPIIYTPFSLDNNFGCGLWVARYSNANTPPVIPAPWKKATIRQFSNGTYGVPNSHPGLGHVDLNTFGPGAKLADIRVPEKDPKPDPKPEPGYTDLVFLHASMQFSDTKAQKEHDADAIFSRGADIITGTEAGGSNQVLRKALRAAAKKYGYRVTVKWDTWVAVKKSLIKNGTWTPGFDGPAITSKQGVGKHTNKGITWATFGTKDLGVITVGAGHYLTKGRPSGPLAQRINLAWNRVLAKAIGAWAKRVGKGNKLALYGGDQNIVDRTDDTFLGEADLTSVWDILEKWPNTGHGNIDVIAKYDKDGRVTFLSARRFTDKQFFLFSDHLLIQAKVRIKHLAK